VISNNYASTKSTQSSGQFSTGSRLGVSAEECAFVDDTEVNVDAARALGLHAVRFRDTAQAIAELDALLA
jgi:putative hydrolase of the HAD superfamily